MEKNNANDNKSTSTVMNEPSSAAVIAFLHSHGLSKAALEVKEFLEKEKNSSMQIPQDKQNDNNENTQGDKNGTLEKKVIKDVEMESPANLMNRAELKFNMATGGGLGYDADHMPTMKFDHYPFFSSKDSPPMTVTGGYDAARFVHSFTTLQTWILNQPDDPCNPSSIMPRWDPPESIKSLVSDPLHLIPPYPTKNKNKTNSKSITVTTGGYGKITYPPPSIKPELISICFPILVHSYCILLESGLDDIACKLWKTWRSIYKPLYPQDTKDLDNLTTTEQMKTFYTTLLSHSDNMVKMRNFKTKENFYSMKKMQSNANTLHQMDQKSMKLDQDISALRTQIKDVQQKMQEEELILQKYPLLSRMKDSKYQVQISTHTWRKLAEFLSRENLKPMYGILQLRCRIIVEARDPLPFSPTGLIEDVKNDDTDANKEATNIDERDNTNKSSINGNESQVQWAAPIHPSNRDSELGEDPTSFHLGRKRSLPFPSYYPKSKTKDDNRTTNEQELESRNIAFNRALRINGFRRLAALEVAQEYETGMRDISYDKKKLQPGLTIHQQSKRLLSSPSNTLDAIADPHTPSILMATCCSGKSLLSEQSSSSALTISSGIATTPHSISNSSTLDESGIGITCASMSPIDGRRIAVGCEDAAIRIFALDGSNFTRNNHNKATMDNSIMPGLDISDSEMILIGHKNGCQIFDVSWNRDGRNLLTAGGDGSLRLWDTMAVGPYGKLSNVQMMKKGNSQNKSLQTNSTSTSKKENSDDPLETGEGPPNANVPGIKPEPLVQVHGAALTVYHGHTINTPIWSCEFAPSGYYFASAGADCTARIWTTDSPKPVRILVGHYSSVNCVSWHPNCNYVLTGSDDKTVRMWDVQTGNCVRLLSGAYSSVNVVKVSPSGRYAVAADISGIISLWDLGSGRKVNEFRGHTGEIHSMSYSACGTALATGGDDCAVKIWDIRGAGVNSTVPEVAKAYDYDGTYGEVKRNIEVFEPPGTRKPVKVFPTKQTMILNLQYTKRNLLMSVGKFVASMS